MRHRKRMEQQAGAHVLTYRGDLDKGPEQAGGMCACCGCGPDENPDWQADPRYIFRAGICDEDGTYYGALCEECLREIRAENRNRPRTERDDKASVLLEMMPNEIVDGVASMMDDDI